MAQNRIVYLFRTRPRPRKPNTVRSYSPDEQAALEEATTQFQAYENRNKDTRRGKAADRKPRGAALTLNLRRTRDRR